MSRTSEKIITTAQLPSGFEHNTQLPKQIWLLTYAGELCSQRTDQSMANQRFKYIRTMWTNKKLAMNHAERCNVLYKDNKFGIRKIK